jgi:hypothetical protein
MARVGDNLPGRTVGSNTRCCGVARDTGIDGTATGAIVVNNRGGEEIHLMVNAKPVLPVRAEGIGDIATGATGL